ncbi:hypothetical protein ACOSQ4_030793 [Xanthoceras sorbifolium]
MSFEASPSKSLSPSSSSSSSSNPEEELDLTALIEAQNSDQPSRGGSIPGHNVIHRGRKEAAHNLWAYYFAENPRYNELMFRRRFRMGRSLFLRIANEVERHDNYFVQRRDGLGRLGLLSLQKITAVFRMLAYGVPADSTDEYIKIGETTSIESMKRFCRAVVEVFGERYLRSTNAYDVARLLQIAHPAHYVIQGKEYSTGYYLANGIYPKWFTLVQIIHDPRGPQKKNKHVLHDIMSACIIMHNMIGKDERDVHADIDN